MRTYLRLVSAPKSQQDTETYALEPTQSVILENSATLIVVAVDELSESDFVDLLTLQAPRLIVETRRVPRFDFGNFNRRKAFGLFERQSIIYAEARPSISSGIAAENNAAMAASVAAVIAAQKVKAAAVLIFIDNSSDYFSEARGLAECVRATTQDNWQLLVLGPSEAAASGREVIFLSHANPEDNDFVLWLGAQLTKYGYQVWSDVTQLQAGEIFWDSIEKVIRHQAARVIAVISTASVEKQGVLDEISLAVATERSQKLDGFVIPVRLDDIPFTEFRANIARKNALDFSKGWSLGLAQLLETLKRAQIPQLAPDSRESLSMWWAKQRVSPVSVVEKSETIYSNWYKLTSVPRIAFLYQFSAIQEIVIDGAKQFVPGVPFRESFISFYSPNEIQQKYQIKLALIGTVSLEDFANGLTRVTSGLDAGMCQRLVQRLLKSHWQQKMHEVGLGRTAMSGQQTAHYFPHDLIPNDRVDFHELGLVKRRKNIVGFSKKRNVYWHFALRAGFKPLPEGILVVRTAVFFSEDGSTLLPKERMASLRRRFCKNWWNDRWFQLQLASMAWLARNGDHVDVFSGEAGRFLVPAIPIAFSSPLSIVEQQIGVDDEILDELADDLVDDAGDDDEFFSSAAEEVGLEVTAHE